MRRLNYAWRVLATGFAFTAFGLGGMLLATLVIPLAALFQRDRIARQQRAQEMVQRSFRLFTWLLQALGILTVEFRNAEALSQCRGNLIVANHPTLIDVVLIMALVPRAQCVVKHQLFRNPFLRGVVRIAGYIRNDLTPEMLMETCRQTLAEGNNLIIFPEGTRSVPGQGFRFHRGFANIATIAAAPIQLVTITCHPIMLTKGAPWYQIPERPSVFHVTVDEKLAIEPFLEGRPRPVAARKLVLFLESYYASKLNHG